MDSRAMRQGWDVIGRSLAGALDTTQQRIAEVRDNGLTKVANTVTAYAKAQPANALLIAGAVGLALGVLSGLWRR